MNALQNYIAEFKLKLILDAGTVCNLLLQVILMWIGGWFLFGLTKEKALCSNKGSERKEKKLLRSGRKPLNEKLEKNFLKYVLEQ